VGQQSPPKGAQEHHEHQSTPRFAKSSKRSNVSIVSAPARFQRNACFLSGIFFQRAHTLESVCVENIHVGDELNGPDGLVVVKSVFLDLPSRDRDIVRVETEDCVISVTSDHRICSWDNGVVKECAAAELLPGGSLFVGPGLGKPYRASKHTKSTEVYNVEFDRDRSVYIVNQQVLAVAKGGPGDPWFGYAAGYGHNNGFGSTKALSSKSAPASTSNQHCLQSENKGNTLVAHSRKVVQVRFKGYRSGDPPILDILTKLATEADCVSSLECLQLDEAHPTSVACLPEAVAFELKEKIKDPYSRWLQSQSCSKGRSTSLQWKKCSDSEG